MSIQWTFIAGYLYLEIAIVIIMILPIFSPRRWNLFFNSRIFSMFRDHAAAYFYVLLGVLSLFLIDAIREMRKYSNTDPASHTHLASEMKGSVKLFRAQRNFYITGFAIFLAFVIRRLVSMLIIQDELSKKAEKIIKEAEATVRQAKSTVLAHSSDTLENNPLAQKYKAKLEVTERLLNESKEKLSELEEECEKWRTRYVEARDAKDNGVRG
ncbi:hypothetical protein PYW07_002957 [Mythimna separata]|uniref:Endoplasmic reticulum transmembrane protein n=1 Tax=Mythimna separata TaxID=271217 RepID=A0AAD7YGV6_MYTSE|nr:hypothetical protein PYW07_002957 [Mythimna separata]